MVGSSNIEGLCGISLCSFRRVPSRCGSPRTDSATSGLRGRADIHSGGINYCQAVNIPGDGTSADPFPLDATTIKVDDLREATIGNETLVLDRSNAQCHVLNTSSSAIWTLMGGELSIGEMIEDIAAGTDLDRAVISPIVMAAVHGFVETGLIDVIVRTEEPVGDQAIETDNGQEETAEDRDAAEQAERRSTRITRRRSWRPFVAKTLDRIPGLTRHGPWQFGDVRATIATDSAEVGDYLDHILAGLRAEEHGPDEQATVRIHIVRRRSEGQELISTYFDGQSAAIRTSPAQSIEVTLRNLNLLATTRTSGSVLLHAGAVEFDGRVVVVTGESGRGKSTLTAALVRAGGAYLTDELVIIEPENLRVRPYPKPLDLDPTSLELLELPPDDGFVVAKRHVAPDELGGISPGGTLAGVFVLGHDRTTVEEFGPIQGVAELLPNVFAATHDSPESLEILARISSSVPIVGIPRNSPRTTAGMVLAHIGGPPNRIPDPESGARTEALRLDPTGAMGHPRVSGV